MTADSGAGRQVVECTCPYGWVVANYGWHRGPGQCPIYDIDAAKRNAHTVEPLAAAPDSDEDDGSETGGRG